MQMWSSAKLLSGPNMRALAQMKARILVILQVNSGAVQLTENADSLLKVPREEVM